jgi:23S rRNA (adenine2503-C2)-methyltransferase
MTSNLYDLDLPALERMLARWGYGRPDARHVWQAVYVDCQAAIRDAAGLPADLRARLDAEAPLSTLDLLSSQEDPGGEARKDLLCFADGCRVEVVLLRYGRRRSACISTQVGCACGCSFCATGQSGYVRDLSAGEIVAQVVHVQRALRTVGEALNNVVLMGMGEPLLNYESTVEAVRRMSDQRGLSIPQRRITLSTVGIAPGIRRLGEEGLGLGLAISLHAATDELRSELVPVNRRYPIADLVEAMRDYAARTGRRVMIEWAMIDGVNDSPAQARALAGLLQHIPAHVNLLRLNPTARYAGHPASATALEAFAARLDEAGIPHTVRQRRGAAITAGCGQLRAETQDRRLPVGADRIGPAELDAPVE